VSTTTSYITGGIWDASIEIAAQTIEKGGSVAQAVANAIKCMRAMKPDATAAHDKAIEDHIRNAVGEPKPAEQPKPVASPESQDISKLHGSTEAVPEKSTDEPSGALLRESGLVMAVIIPISAFGMFLGMLLPGYFDKSWGSSSALTKFFVMAAVYLCFGIAMMAPIIFWFMMSEREQKARIFFLFQIGIFALVGWLGYGSIINAGELLASKTRTILDCAEAYAWLCFASLCLYGLFNLSDAELFKASHES
jgi:hypothetical protein